MNDSITHITPAGGNVFLDLGFPPEEATELKAESQHRIAAQLALENSQPGDTPEDATAVPIPWDVFVENGQVRFKIGVQSFTLDYAPEDEPGWSAEQARHWMASMLRQALAKLQG